MDMRKSFLEAHRTIQQSCPEMNIKFNRNIIACLKSAQIAWEEYINTPTKTGQLASKYLKKFKIIDRRLQEQLNQLLTKGLGSAAKIKELKKLFEDVINQLERKAKKYLQHEADMQLMNLKSEQAVLAEENQEDQIKQQMLELVEKFKKYAVEIQDDLEKDTDVISDINSKQDRQLTSLQKKSQGMKEIIKNQNIGFFQLLAMGIIGIALWVFGLFVILII